jgi:threonine aldolase
MISFNCDYSEGAHPRILEKLTQTNFEQTGVYGEDIYCQKAAELILNKCHKLDAEVHFFVGGTQTNLTLISAALRPHQGVVAAATGHINVHETGAIEATGHKVLAQPSPDGKLTAEQIRQYSDDYLSDANRDHIVQPGMVYISNPTELGTIYTNAELTAISQICRDRHLFLYLDGARLGYALCAEDNDLDLPRIAELCDAFYIGGTKIGALFGEALVLCSDVIKKDFRCILKQKGAMLAKGRLLGLQFLALFEDDLYFELSAHAIAMARLIKEACEQKGYAFLSPSTTNQQFPIFPDALIDTLSKNYSFEVWQRMDPGHSAVRFCTSWATQEAAVSKLIAQIEES